MTALETILAKWLGTPYAANKRVPRYGVDCVNFVDAVLCELHERELPAIDPVVPGSLIDPRVAAAVMNLMLARHPNVELNSHWDAGPGDVVLCRSSGMPHVGIVGELPGQLWQVSANGVHFTGLDACGAMRAWEIIG